MGGAALQESIGAVFLGNHRLNCLMIIKGDKKQFYLMQNFCGIVQMDWKGVN